MGLVSVTHPGTHEIPFVHGTVTGTHALHSCIFTSPRDLCRDSRPHTPSPAHWLCPMSPREKAGGVPEHRGLDGRLKGPGRVQV